MLNIDGYRYNDFEMAIDTQSLPDILNVFDVVVPVKNFPLEPNIWLNQLSSYPQRAKDYQVMRDVIAWFYPECIDSVDKLFNGNYFFGYNMFIAKRKFFEEYSEWLFHICFEVEKRLYIPYDDPHRRKIFGYMGEFLFTIYIIWKKIKIKETPLLSIANVKSRYSTNEHA